ncbi:AraC family transcriptional regulator [Telmatobacter bradus]|uniref:AraC family transcriptional regulator n=1 Tax=Telmatobacter bradus TaxID=474953 RepID=UPI003B42B4E9
MQKLDQQQTLAYIERIGLENAAQPAFGYLDVAANTRYDWHQHSCHQLMYSLQGSAQVEVGSRRYMLPPQRVAWISAGTPHRTTIGDLAGASIFFQPALITWDVEPVCVFAAQPLLRAMIDEAMRWESEAKAVDDLRGSFFRTLALLCRDWTRAGDPFWLPGTDDAQLSRAIDYTLQHLQDATVQQASAAAAMSERSFRRHFVAALGLSWRDYLVKARLLQSLALLSKPSARIIDVASEIGFDSPSSFTKAFGAFTGETPRVYQNRIHSNDR